MLSSNNIPVISVIPGLSELLAGGERPILIEDMSPFG